MKKQILITLNKYLLKFIFIQYENGTTRLHFLRVRNYTVWVIHEETPLRPLHRVNRCYERSTFQLGNRHRGDVVDNNTRSCCRTTRDILRLGKGERLC